MARRFMKPGVNGVSMKDNLPIFLDQDRSS